VLYPAFWHIHTFNHTSYRGREGGREGGRSRERLIRTRAHTTRQALALISSFGEKLRSQEARTELSTRSEETPETEDCQTQALPRMRVQSHHQQQQPSHHRWRLARSARCVSHTSISDFYGIAVIAEERLVPAVVSHAEGSACAEDTFPPGSPAVSDGTSLAASTSSAPPLSSRRRGALRSRRSSSHSSFEAFDTLLLSIQLRELPDEGGREDGSECGEQSPGASAEVHQVETGEAQAVSPAASLLGWLGLAAPWAQLAHAGANPQAGVREAMFLEEGDVVSF